MGAALEHRQWRIWALVATRLGQTILGAGSIRAKGSASQARSSKGDCYFEFLITIPIENKTSTSKLDCRFVSLCISASKGSNLDLGSHVVDAGVESERRRHPSAHCPCTWDGRRRSAPPDGSPPQAAARSFPLLLFSPPPAGVSWRRCSN